MSAHPERTRIIGVAPPDERCDAPGCERPAGYRVTGSRERELLCHVHLRAQQSTEQLVDRGLREARELHAAGRHDDARDASDVARRRAEWLR